MEIVTEMHASDRDRDSSDDELPTIEQILSSTTPRDSFMAVDSSLNKPIQGPEGLICETGGFTDHNRSVLGDNLGRSSGERVYGLIPWDRI